MHIQLIAVGTKMPDWVERGFNEYATRLPREWHFKLHEIPLAKRTKNKNKNADSSRLMQQEADNLLARATDNALIVALDSAGRLWDTPALARQFSDWMNEARDLAFLIGGPDGLHHNVKQRAHLSWSLSALTFPHTLVRIMVVEQLYRAWSLLNNHPYHRA